MNKEKKTFDPMSQVAPGVLAEKIASLMPEVKTNWAERGRQMLKLIGGTADAILMPEGFEETKRQFSAMKEMGEEVSAGDFEALFSAYARERPSDAAEVNSVNITVDHSQIFGSVRVFEDADPWKVIEWFGKNRPAPESDAVMDDCIFVSFPDGKVITGTSINRWIYDMVYGDLSKGIPSQSE